MIAMLFTVTPVAAATEGGGPWGDIDGYYTWQINGKGWTVYSQNGYSWIYDNYGNRTYLDSYGNQLYGVTQAAAKTITEMKLTYHSTENGVTVYSNPNGILYTVDSNGRLNNYGGGGGGGEHVANYVMYYTYTSANGYNVYCDDYGNYWWFSAGGTPNRWTGSSEGSYWRTDVHNYTYYFAFKSSEGYYIYRDDYGNSWWFGAGGVPHKYGGSGGFNPGGNVTPGGSGKPAETDVDYNHTNVMEANGVRTVVYVGQYWQAPTTVSWAPQGTKLIGWDYAEGTNHVRWKPGEWIKSTGSDLFLYPVYGSSGTGSAGIGASH